MPTGGRRGGEWIRRGVCFVLVLCLSGFRTTTSEDAIEEPSVAVMAGTEFAHPATLQGLDLKSFANLLALAGSEGAWGAFYSQFGVPDCQEAPYFLCKTSKTSAEGATLLESAEKRLLIASQMEERDDRVWILLALVEIALKRPSEALDAVEKYLSEQSGSQERIGMELLLKAHLMATRNCFWDDLPRISALVAALTKNNSSKQFPPLHYVELDGVAAEDVKRNCETAAALLLAKVQGTGRVKHAGGGKIKLDKSKRLNLGYINAVGFNDVYLFLALVFGRNQAQFHVTCYAAQAAARQSGARQHMEQYCDAFVDLSRSSPAEMAARIAADKIHVLVELNGYTQGADAPFLEALAHSPKPAPIQLHFHGQPFTTGAPFIDGYVGDVTSTPVEYREFYTERLILLPDYYLMHSLPAIKGKTGRSDTGEYSRADFGFQESDLVLASFLQPYKIEPRVFHTWAGILDRVPQAKLWLFRYRVQGIGGGRELEANLHAALKAANMSPNRVVLSDLFPEQHQHQIKRMADLFLDTFIFNAHTTAYDALFAGLPVLSLANQTQPSRVASSLLKAVPGLQLCIARNERDYEELAVRLLSTVRHDTRKKKTLKGEQIETVAIRDIKRRLAKTISGPVPAPLFDPRAFTVAFEAATRMAVEVKCSDEEH